MKCITCGVDYPLTEEYFEKSKQSKSGFRGQCSICRKKYTKKFRDSHKEEAKIKHHDWYFEHKEENIPERREYYSKNREHILEYGRNYTKSHQEGLAIKHHDWYLEHRVRLRELKRLDRIRNPNKYKERESKYPKEKSLADDKRYRQSVKGKISLNLKYERRRTRKKNLIVDFSKEDWEKCLSYFNNSCAYCGKETKLTIEHFIPISQNGEYTKHNIICCCDTCNSSKQSRNFFDWYPKKHFYSKKREQRILKYLNYDEQTRVQQLLL